MYNPLALLFYGGQPRMASGLSWWRMAFWAVLLAVLSLGVAGPANAQDCPKPRNDTPPFGPGAGGVDRARQQAADLFDQRRTVVTDEWAPYHEAVRQANDKGKFLVLWVGLDGKYPELRRQLEGIAIHCDLKRQFKTEATPTPQPRIVFTDIDGREFFVKEANIHDDAAKVIQGKMYESDFPGKAKPALQRTPGRPGLSEEIRYGPPATYYVPTYYVAPAYYPAQRSVGVGASINVGRFSVGAQVGTDCRT
jgi:hypothetical protein